MVKERITIVSLLLLLVTIFGVDHGFTQEDFLINERVITSNVLSQNDETYGVSRVIDGDTIELENGEKVRYIGIDTPELKGRDGKECFADRAKQANTRLVEGKIVRLEKDVSEKDRYGRLLRYVYVSLDGEELLVNNWLVENGYAYAASFPPDVAKQELFSSAQTRAREENKGLWNDCI